MTGSIRQLQQKTPQSVQIRYWRLPSYSPITDDMAKGVIRICWDELYTTYGLRTLDPDRINSRAGRREGWTRG